MGSLGRGALLIVGLSFLSSCASFRAHLHKKYYGQCQCISAQDKRDLDRYIDEAVFEADNKDVDGFTRTMRRLQRERFKRKIKPCGKTRKKTGPVTVTSKD
jgi:hypothetical protein